MSSNYLEVVRSVFNGSSQRQAAQVNGVSRDAVSVLVKYAHSRRSDYPSGSDRSDSSPRPCDRPQFSPWVRSRRCCV